MITSEYLGTNV